MSTVQRFFRKYFLSTVGILLLFLVVNIVLAGVVLITSYNNSTAPDVPISQLADMVTETGGTISAAQEVSETLAGSDAWAMLLDDGGRVIWEQRMPDDLPRSYTATQIAKFSRWYLQDYPVYVWEHPSGLFVVGYPPNSMQKHNISVDASYLSTNIFGLLAAFIVNVLLMLLLFWHSTHKVEKAVRPILTGINTMTQGKPVTLEERGELAEVNAELNRAGEQLQKKDTARAEWINGISHDIRTPLSIMLGYAGEMEDDSSLPADVQKQAGIIRKQGEKLQQLITDLNLASKLEYAMQPMKKMLISPVELARQSMSDFINNGLDERYSLELSIGAGAEKVLIEGDNALLIRMLGNIIGNSISHNPDGCDITLSVEASGATCKILVADTGRGADERLLVRLNDAEQVTITQNDRGEASHGNGLKLVKQIVKAHKGAASFSNAAPHGLNVLIEIPIKNRL